MNKQYLYELAVGIVCRITGVSEAMMVGSNREECVDARVILINSLLEKGLTESEVVSLTRFSQQRVNSLKNSLSKRLVKWTFKTNIHQVNKELTNELQRVVGITG